MKKRDLSYTERDYEGLKDQLRSLAEKYYPSTFRNFSEYSIETMLMEMVAYTGDVVNFYLDDRFRQNFIQHTNDLESVFRLAKSRGYKPNTVSVSYGEITVSQLVGVDDSEQPELDDCVRIRSGATFSDNSSNIIFTSLEACDFKEYDDYEVVEAQNGVPQVFRVFKKIKVRSGERKTKRIEVTQTDPYPEFYLDDDVAFVTSITDSDNNNWYQVDFLAQDTIFEGSEIENYSSEYEVYKSQTPYILTSKRISRRYEVDHKSDGKCFLKFGSGVDDIDSSLKNLSSEDLLTTNDISKVMESSNLTIENFLRSDSFGIRPYNTTLFVEYVKSRGEEENVNEDTITNILNTSINYSNNADRDIIDDSFEVTNEEAITGGSFNNNVEKIKSESSEAFFTQRRCVTVKDYILRSKMLPSIYGNISKVFVERDSEYVSSKGINIYTLSKNTDGYLEKSNRATKENLLRYLNEFKIVSDRINIYDPYIINIGVDFKFLSKKGFDNDEVLLNISRKVEEFFDVGRWELNQPILVGELIQHMDTAEGVVSITEVDIVNKYSEEEGYSNVKYDTSVNGENYSNEKMVLYPPLDVGIFEMKFPLVDISGKHV